MSQWTSLFVAAAAVLVFYVVRIMSRFVAVRRRFASLPGPPHSALWGHLEAIDKHKMNEYYAHIAMHEMYKENGEDIFFLDGYPFVTPMTVINTVELAEQVTSKSKTFPFSAPKDPVYKTVQPAFGETSILLAEGEHWRMLRKKFSPGFQPGHLNGLLPGIVDATRIFTRILSQNDGKEVEMVNLTSALTVDIIFLVLCERTLNAQTSSPEFTTLHRSIIDWCFRTDELNPFKRYNPFRPLMLAYYTSKLDKLIREYLMSNLQLQKDEGRSIMALGLKGYSGDETQMREAIDQVKTFFVGGHETSSTTIAWVFYELSKNKNCLQRLRSELREVFGESDGLENRASKLLVEKSEETLSRLVYTTACIKETLRLRPRTSTFRCSPEGAGFTITSKGTTFNLDGTSICVNAQTIQRDPKVFGEDADVFRPERWLVPGFDPGKAYRPFETGFRNCMGQALAMLELKVILAMTASQFDFEKVGYDGMTEKEVYDIRTLIASPIDRMRMRVRALKET